MRRTSPLPAALLLLGVACGGASPPPTTVQVAAAPPPAPPPPPPELKACERGTARLLDALHAPLKVTVWVTTGTPELAAFARALDELFKGYERLAPGKIHPRVIEAKTDAERAMAKEAGMQAIGQGQGRRDEVTSAFLGISFEYKSEKEAIPILSPEKPLGIAYWVARKIREIRDRADNGFDKFGVLTGKDEIKLADANLVPSQGRGQGPSMKGILEQALPFYKFEDVDLQGGQAEINGELAGLVVTQPGRDYTEPELRRIDQFLMRGHKAIAVFAGAVDMKASDPAMRAELHAHGLERLLDGYGVELRNDVVLDWGHPASIEVRTQGAPVKLSAPGIPLVQFDPRADDRTQSLDQRFAGFFLLEEIPFPFPSTLVPHADRQPGATLRVVARTSPRSTVLTGATVDLKPTHEQKPHGEQVQRALAVAVEGKIKSAFAGTPDRAAPGSRLLVVASPQFLANPWARAGNPPPRPPQLPPGPPGDEELLLIAQPYAQQYLTSTILAFKNTLDWMASSDDVLACVGLELGK